MVKYFFAFIVPLFLISCSDRSLPVKPKVSTSAAIKEFRLPASLSSGQTYTLSVLIDNPTVAGDVEFIDLTISRKASDSPYLKFKLYDDGGAVQPNSGDVVAYDAIFSYTLKWKPADNSDEDYVLLFDATPASGMTVASLEKEFASFRNFQPRLLTVTLPDSLPDGFDGFRTCTASAEDSNGVEDITAVQFKAAPLDNSLPEFKGALLDDGLNGDAVAGDGLFTLQFDRTYAVGKKGRYEMTFYAVDRTGEKSESRIADMNFANFPPVISDLTAPDSVQRPTQNEEQFLDLVTIHVRDNQTLADIKSVRVIWEKPDGTFAEDSPLQLFDNGLPVKPPNFDGWQFGYRGDEVAGDGVYSITIVFDNNVAKNPLGDYKLTFYAEDWAGNTSEKIEHIIATYWP